MTLSLEMGLTYAFLIMVLGSCALTALALYVRAHHTKSNVVKPRNRFTAIIEKCADTGLYVGYVPGMPGAHTQGATFDELNMNLREVLGMLVEDGIAPESEFVGTQLVSVQERTCTAY